MKLNKNNQAINVNVTEEEWGYLYNLDCCHEVINHIAGESCHVINIQAVVDDINQHDDIYVSDVMKTIKAYAETMLDVGYTLFLVDL